MVVAFGSGCSPSIMGTKSSISLPFTFSSIVVSPITGAPGTIITLTGEDFSAVTDVLIGSVSCPILSQTSTSLEFMLMPGVSYDRVHVMNGVVELVSSDFFIPTSMIASAPTTQQGLKLVASDYVGTPRQGSTVAVSADGNTAIVGGAQDDAFIGAVWIYERTGGVWGQQGNKIIGTGAVGTANAGTSVAISANGNTAAYGAQMDNTQRGAVWVFTRSGSTWTQQGTKLVPSGVVAGDRTASSIALSADGNTLVMGAASYSGGTGRAWVFRRSGGVWAEDGGYLQGTGGDASSRQGSGVAISGDGNTIFIGGEGDSAGIGAGWIFVRSGGVWTQQGSKLVGSAPGVGAPSFGAPGSVALSADGNTAAIGAYLGLMGVGAVWVFTRSGGVWTEESGGGLLGTGATGSARQGASVSLSADGNVLASGGYSDNAGVGAVWTFTRAGGVWSQSGSKLVPTGNTGAARIGCSVSLSADASTLLVGGDQDNTNIGAAWVFEP